MQAKHVLRRVVDTLVDKKSVSWRIDELVRWLNDGQRVLAIHRPDAFATVATGVLLVPGVRQALPPDAIKLIDVPNNAVGLEPIRKVERTELDVVEPQWRSRQGARVIKHFMHDPRAPLRYDVYPPAAAGAAVDLVYSAYPVDVAEPAPGKTWDDVAGDIAAPDIYETALVDYVLSRAYARDSSHVGHGARSQAHYEAFMSALGVELNSSLTVAPRTGGA